MAKEEIHEGCLVRLRDVSDPAKVLRIMQNGNLEVAIGFLKMQIPPTEVTEILPTLILRTNCLRAVISGWAALGHAHT